jgi:maltose alpha-D-glucosyltransferase/alpha-amylase
VQLANRTEKYHLPLGIFWDGESTSPLAQQLALARVRQTRRMGYLTDAFAIDSFPLGVIRAIRASTIIAVAGGEIRCIPTSQLHEIELGGAPEIRRLSAEQSNSSIIVGQKIIMKLIRRVMEGVNPEIEMIRHLTLHGYANTPPLLGEVALVKPDGTGHSMIVAQKFLQNQGDAWQYTLDYLARFLETMAVGGKTPADEADELSGYAPLARAIGTRLAELHALLARPSDDPAFAPARADAARAGDIAAATMAQIKAALAALTKVADGSDAATADAAKSLIARQDELIAAVGALSKSATDALETRVHGDFHLGQVLVATGDAYLIDFEGEPVKPLEMRRAKSSPLRDVAGLLRSLHYAAATAAQSRTTGADMSAAISRFTEDMSKEFLTAYRRVAHNATPRWTGDAATEQALLDLFLLEKAAYEICYEAANRPAWLPIPLRGLSEILTRLLHRTDILQDA